MADLLTPERALELTEPHHKRWVGAYRFAEAKLAALREFDAEMFLAMSSLTKVNFVRDMTIHRAQRSGTEIATSDALGTFTEIIAGDKQGALVRFKELDSEHRRYNHKSTRQDNLDYHEYDEEEHKQLMLDGSQPEPTMLTCGWVPLGDGLTISQIVIVCHWGRRELWHYDLETGAGAQIVSLPGIKAPEKSTVRLPASKEKREPEAE